MKEIINFLLENYRLIADCLLVIVAFIFFLIKKKPVKFVDTLKDIIVTWLPSVLISAEKSGYKGEAKLNYALDLIYNLFVKDYYSREEFNKKYLPFVTKQIEAILSTPQKKGVNYER